jgi:hypothetical protein
VTAVVLIGSPEAVLFPGGEYVKSVSVKAPDASGRTIWTMRPHESELMVAVLPRSETVDSLTNNPFVTVSAVPDFASVTEPDSV